MAAPSSSSKTPRIPDDTIFYSIYPDSSSSGCGAADSSAVIRSLHVQINSLISPLTAGYIWQHEPFNLTLPSLHLPRCRLCSTSPNLPHLHGKSKFGDNLDDEWFIVYLLFLISDSIPDVSIRTWDSDGEFLLIEAAFDLPKWLQPNSSVNRVFIRQNQLHIIPKSMFSSSPDLREALRVVSDDNADTRASPAIQSAIRRKIDGYPEKAMSNMHRTNAVVPLPVAQVLKHEPCLISLAVEAFYDRDIDSMKHAAKMEKFVKDSNGEVEMVRVSVKMSKTMYAQLVQQRFQPPRCYPRMPSREDGPVAFAEAELGMKITVGFEMMYQERKKAGEEVKGSTWDAFMKSLENSGCFEGLLPGAKEYQRIMDNALEYYKNSTLFSRSRDMMNAPVQRIDEILSLPYSVNDFKDVELPPGDDDSWMYNGEQELNSALQERQKVMEIYEAEHKKTQEERDHKGSGKDFDSQENDFNLGYIAESMQAFVQKLSSFEGAEVPENGNSQAVELDVDLFMKEMESIVGHAWQGGPSNAKFDEGDTGSSDMEFDDSEDGSDLDEPGNNDNDNEFMQSYSDALNKELNETILKRSFVRANEETSIADEGTSGIRKDDMMEEDLTPVDVDVNLVKSFLDSFSSQQGLPGPASNLLGLMGVDVPRDSKKL